MEKNNSEVLMGHHITMTSFGSSGPSSYEHGSMKDLVE